MRAMQYLAALLFVVVTANLASADAIDNPKYKSWAQCKPGTKVVLKAVSGKDSTKAATLTETLIEVTAEKCVVELSRDLPGGKPFKHNIDIDKQIKDEEEIKRLKDAMTHADEQSVTTAAGTFKCKHVKISREGGSVTEAWYCPDVPGGTVKAISTDAQHPGTEELQSVDKK